MERRWADAESSSEEEIYQNVITSMPRIPTKQRKQPKKRKTKKRKEEDHFELDPNLVTKLTLQQKGEDRDRNIRENGTLASRKQIKKKEMDELDSILNEFGLTPSQQTPLQQNTPKPAEKPDKSKTNKREIFQNVRAEINARQEKKKKRKKNNYPKQKLKY